MPKVKEPVWVSTDDFKPVEYELCKLLTKKSQIHIGWWTGHSWDGLNLNECKDILMWQKHHEGHGL